MCCVLLPSILTPLGASALCAAQHAAPPLSLLTRYSLPPLLTPLGAAAPLSLLTRYSLPPLLTLLLARWNSQSLASLIRQLI